MKNLGVKDSHNEEFGCQGFTQQGFIIKNEMT